MMYIYVPILNNITHKYTHAHTNVYTKPYATATSAFRALCGTIDALVFLNTTSPCDGARRERKRKGERSRHLFVSQWRPRCIELS